LAESQLEPLSTIAFYGSTPAYRPVLDRTGCGDLQEELNRLSKQGKWLEMTGLIDDALLERIAVVGPRKEIAGKLVERYGGLVDRISLVAPFASDESLWSDIIQAVKAC